MTAPDTADLEDIIIGLEGATTTLWLISDGCHDKETTEALGFIASNMRRNCRAAREWFEKAAETEQVAAKGSGPRAVT